MAIDNERGFTMISMLMTLSVIMITLPLLAQIIILTTVPSSYDELSMNQFFYFLRDEVSIAADYSVKQDVLTLELENGDTITFKKYKELVVRQVDGKGYDVFLRSVEDIRFRKLSYGVHIAITSLEGEQYEKNIVFLE